MFLTVFLTLFFCPWISFGAFYEGHVDEKDQDGWLMLGVFCLDEGNEP